jgi:hypothetical protein
MPGRPLTKIVVSALLQFAFQLGGAISLCISQTLFLEELTSAIRYEVSLDSLDIVHGKAALDLATSVTLTAETNTLRKAYQSAFHSVFVFLVVVSGPAFLASFGTEHKNIKTVEQGQKKSKNDGGNHNV